MTGQGAARLVRCCSLASVVAGSRVRCSSSSSSGDAQLAAQADVQRLPHRQQRQPELQPDDRRPSGSSTLNGPITLSFGGPFQSLGKGKLPKSNFNVSISALGKTGSLGILSTGTTGYVTLQGTSYQLPAATFQKLESSFAALASSPGGGSGSGRCRSSGSIRCTG